MGDWTTINEAVLQGIRLEVQKKEGTKQPDGVFPSSLYDPFHRYLAYGHIFPLEAIHSLMHCSTCNLPFTTFLDNPSPCVVTTLEGAAVIQALRTL